MLNYIDSDKDGIRGVFYRGGMGLIVENMGYAADGIWDPELCCMIVPGRDSASSIAIAVAAAAKGRPPVLPSPF